MLVVLICIIIGAKMLGKPVFVLGHTILWVETGSMETEIPAESYILIHKASARDVRVGDIICFKSDDPAILGRRNTHRVVEIIGDHEEFVTKGDNNPSNDEFTAKAENIVGLYECNLDTLTVIGRFVTTPLGIAVCSICVGLVMIYMYFTEFVYMHKEKQLMNQIARESYIEAQVAAEVEFLRSIGAIPENSDEPDDDAEI